MEIQASHKTNNKGKSVADQLSVSDNHNDTLFPLGNLNK